MEIRDKTSARFAATGWRARLPEGASEKFREERGGEGRERRSNAMGCNYAKLEFLRSQRDGKLCLG